MIKHVCDVCGKELGREEGKKPRALGIEWCGFNVTFVVTLYDPISSSTNSADLCYDCLLRLVTEGERQ